MLRLSLINSSQDSLSLHSNIKSLETSRYVWWLRFHLKKKVSNWHRPWIDSGQSRSKVIYSFINSSVRSFVHSFILFVHSLICSWLCDSCRNTFVRSVTHVFIYAPFYKRVSSCRYKGNVLCRWPFLKYSKNFRSL